MAMVMSAHAVEGATLDDLITALRKIRDDAAGHICYVSDCWGETFRAVEARHDKSPTGAEFINVKVY